MIGNVCILGGLALTWAIVWVSVLRPRRCSKCHRRYTHRMILHRFPMP